MKYIVKVQKDMFTFYIQKVINYKKQKVKLTIDIDSAYKYCLEENAIKASNSFNGEVIIV